MKMKMINGSINKIEDLNQSISINSFQFYGSYSPETNTFKETLPQSINDFVFEIDPVGLCYVITEQKYEYDDKTGAFYLIEEVK